MDKYIKLSDVMKKLNYIFRTYGTSQHMKETIRNAIRKIPYVAEGELESTLEATDTSTTGKWIDVYGEVKIYNAGGFTEKQKIGVECSACHWVNRWCVSNYCPNCGAEMEEKS